MEAFQMIRSITDAEMQEKILSETLEKALSLEEIVKLAQNIESAKLSSGLIMKNGTKANKISEESTEQPKFGKFGHCGSRHKGEGDQESRKKFCWAWKLSCNKCKTKGHIARVCKSKKTQNNVIEDDDESKGETDAISFKLFNIEKNGLVANLAHTGVNEFGRWARIRVKDHPEVFVSMEADKTGYNQLMKNNAIRPGKLKVYNGPGLVDSGA